MLLLYARDESELWPTSSASRSAGSESALQVLARLDTSDLRRPRAVRLPRRHLAAVGRGALEDRARPRRPCASASSCSATRTSTAGTRTSRCSIRPPYPTLPRDATARYLVFRQLRQDVHGFWSFVDQATRRAGRELRPRAPPAPRREDGRPLAERRTARARTRRRRRRARRGERLRLLRARPARRALPRRRAHPARESARLARSETGNAQSRGRSTGAIGSCAAAASTDRRSS